MNSTIRPLDQAECYQLAEVLGDTPETVIPVHLLRRGLCEAYAMGDLSGVYGAIVRDLNVYDEPAAFGNSPDMICTLLLSLTGWFCVNIAAELAKSLGVLIEKGMGGKVRYYGDVHYTLTTPVKQFGDAAVRQLTPDDLILLEAAKDDVRATGFGGPGQLLENGFAAGAVVDGQVVAIAQSYARTEGYADVGVATLPEYRGRGYATAAASIVAQRLQEAGQIPVWSTGEDNYASQRIAQKLGFTEVGRRVYVILEK